MCNKMLSEWYVSEWYFCSFTNLYEVKGKAINSTMHPSILKLKRIPKAMALVCTSGWMETQQNEFAIIKPLVDAEGVEGKILQTWKTGENREEHVLGEGPNIIAPGHNYLWPYGVPFIPLFAHTD
jgi:hypothetical protein